MTKHDEQLHFRAPKKLADAVRQKVSEEGTSFAAYMRRAIEHEMEGVYQSGTQAESEQLDRVEANVEVLYHGMVAMAQRQELSMVAQAATMEAVRVLGGQVNEMGTVMERRALPEQKHKQQAPRLGPTEDALRRKYGDAAVDDYLRRIR